VGHFNTVQNKAPVMISLVLRKIFGPKRNEVTWEWRRLRNEELYDFCPSSNIIGVIKSRRIKRGHVTWIWVFFFKIPTYCTIILCFNNIYVTLRSSIIRRTNCITTASGIVTLCKQPYSMQVAAVRSPPAYCTAAYRG